MSDDLDRQGEDLEQLWKSYEGHDYSSSAPGNKNYTATQDQPWSPQLITSLSFGVLAFGIVVIFAFAYLLLKKVDWETIVRSFSIPLIVLAGIFLIIVGYSDRQMAPMFGLLGSLAGYVFGSSSVARTNTSSSGQQSKLDSEEK